MAKTRDSPVLLQGMFADALRHHQAGHLAEAERLYRQVLAIDKRHADALHLLGVAAYQSGRPETALDLIGQAIRLRNNVHFYYNNLGNALRACGKLDEAIVRYRRAVSLNPDYADAHNNLGSALKGQGKIDQAVTHLERALALAPDHAEAHNNLGHALQLQGRSDDAARCYRCALELKPDLAQAHLNLGTMLRDQGKLDDAALSFERVCALTPEDAEAHHGLGGIRHKQGRLDDAAAAFERTLSLRPDHVEALCDLAVIRMVLGDFAGARELYKRAMAARPNDPMAFRFYLASLLYDPDLDLDAVFAEHRRFDETLGRPCAGKLPPPANPRDPDRKLRVGWLSADMHDHPVMRNLMPVFAHRDRAQFDDFFYAEPAQTNDIQAALREFGAGWRPVAGLSDEAVAAQIRADNIDILMVLASHFDRNRPLVAAFRPAPVQVSIFDPATSGLSAMDYLALDSVMVPAHPKERFSERPLRLPNLYLHPALNAPPPRPPPSLAAGRVTFGCFNNPAKVNDRVLELWARVLDRVPGSRLMLRYFNLYQAASLRARVERVMGACGIDAARIDMGGASTPTADHLAEIASLDVALDPFPFAGSTTTFETLWMGVPVVALAGSSVVARWTAAMLSQVGLADLVASTQDDYVDLAAGLAADRERLARLRSELRAMVAGSLMCEARRTTRYLERVQRAIWRRWCATPATPEPR